MKMTVVSLSMDAEKKKTGCDQEMFSLSFIMLHWGHCESDGKWLKLSQLQICHLLGNDILGPRRKPDERFVMLQSGAFIFCIDFSDLAMEPQRACRNDHDLHWRYSLYIYSKSYLPLCWWVERWTLSLHCPSNWCCFGKRKSRGKATFILVKVDWREKHWHHVNNWELLSRWDLLKIQKMESCSKKTDQNSILHEAKMNLL